MNDIQQRLPKARIYRFDNGEGYYIHSVMKALVTCVSKGVTAAKKELMRFSYGNEGWPDLLVGHNGKTLGIEVKIGKDKQSEKQKSMQLQFNIMGWLYTEFTDQKNYESQLEEICQLLKQ